MESPVQRAIEIKGGVTALAAELGESSQTVVNWRARGVPVEKCATFERVMAGAVTRKHLRPDDWAAVWPELAPTNSASE